MSISHLFLFFKIIYFTIPFLLLNSCGSINQQTDLIGKITFEQWIKSKYWNDYEYANFQIDSVQTSELKTLMQQKRVKIVIFASIYCEDCLVKMPHIIKLFQVLQIPAEDIQFYGLDEYSTEPSGFYKQYKFPSTPAVFLIGNDDKRVLINSSNDIIKEIEIALRKL